MRCEPLAGGVQGAAYPYHWGALRPAMSTSFLSLLYSSLVRSSDASYAARLFNYAQYQVRSANRGADVSASVPVLGTLCVFGLGS